MAICTVSLLPDLSAYEKDYKPFDAVHSFLHIISGNDQGLVMEGS